WGGLPRARKPLRRLVERLLQRKPQRRFTAAGFLAALRLDGPDGPRPRGFNYRIEVLARGR
ncbi:unnamed protein product, partial [Effrenium voratum]